MPKITTVSVHPERRERLKEYRDERGHSNLDEALGELLNQRDE